MYLVVCFGKTDEVDVVPSTWVLESGSEVFCYWPPYKSASRITKAKQVSEPFCSDWTCQPVKIMYRSGM